jgi:hypothetical protein
MSGKFNSLLSPKQLLNIKYATHLHQPILRKDAEYMLVRMLFSFFLLCLYLVRFRLSANVTQIPSISLPLSETSKLYSH